MHNHVKIPMAVLTIGLLAACVGCSTDQFVWGQEGAAVRSVSNEFVEQVRTAGDSAHLCTESNADLGDPADWAGLAAGEPEKYDGSSWEEYADLSPSWLINLSAAEVSGEDSQREVPAFLFFQGSGEDLCVVDVAWGERFTTP